MTEIKNIFISHLHKDDDGLSKLTSLAKEHGLDVRDASISNEKPNNAKDPDYILNSIIKPGINWCSALAVYITPDTRNSEWVEKEIMMAAKLGKRIVGVYAHGHKDCDPPEILTQMADAIVGWNGKNLVDALTGKFNEREDADGKLCAPIPFKHVECG